MTDKLEWLKTQLKKLDVDTSKFSKEIRIISDVDKEIYNEFHEWTPLKLIFLHHALSIYTTIMNKSKFYNWCV